MPLTKAQMAAAICVVLALSSLSLLTIGEGTMRASIAYNVHSPIVIDDNSDFSGWPGDGSAANPFIIRDLEIDAVGVTNAIYIGNVTAHFTISSCHLLNAQAGVWLFNTTNGTLEHNICELNTYGIYSIYSANNTIVNNTCSTNSQHGIYLTLSWWTDTVNNTCNYNTANGILVEDSFMMRTEKNTCLENSDGIKLTGCIFVTVNESDCSSNIDTGIVIQTTQLGLVANNTCNDNSYEGMSAETCANISFSDNDCDSNYYDGLRVTDSYMLDIHRGSMTFNTCGFYIEYSDHIGLWAASATENWYDAVYVDTCSNLSVYWGVFNSNYGYGMEIYTSYNMSLANNNCSVDDSGGIYLDDVTGTLMNNTCLQTYLGLEVDESNGVSIANCILSDNQYQGLYLYYCDSITVTDNVVSGNGADGILVESSNCQIQSNIISSNTGYGVYMGYSSSSNLVLDNTIAFNRGSGTSYDPSTVQGYDDGSGNSWYIEGTPHGFGNYWEDWARQGDHGHDGIVDTPYVLDGSAGTQDLYPLADPSEPIPEFGLVVPVLISMLGIAFLMAKRREGK